MRSGTPSAQPSTDRSALSRRIGEPAGAGAGRIDFGAKRDRLVSSPHGARRSFRRRRPSRLQFRREAVMQPVIGLLLIAMAAGLLTWGALRMRDPAAKGWARKAFAAEFLSILLIAMFAAGVGVLVDFRSDEHPSELQSLMRISYAVFC